MIPDETLHGLLTLVRTHLPSHAKDEDDDYHVAPAKRSSTSAPKSKKNKPMSKYEQEDTISRIKEQLEAFQNPGSASKSPESQYSGCVVQRLVLTLLQTISRLNLVMTRRTVGLRARRSKGGIAHEVCGCFFL